MDENNEIAEALSRIPEPTLRFVVCPMCGEVSRYEDAGETGICDKCAEASRIRQERTAARKKAKEVLRKMISAARPTAIDAPHISQVCASVIKEMGGMDRFCHELAEDYQDAREKNPGSATVMRFGETILRLVRDSTQQRGSAPDVVDMSDEDIVSEMLTVMDDVARRKQLESAEDSVLALLEAEALDESEGSDPSSGERVQEETD